MDEERVVDDSDEEYGKNIRNAREAWERGTEDNDHDEGYEEGHEQEDSWSDDEADNVQYDSFG